MSRHTPSPWRAERCDIDGDDDTRWSVLTDTDPAYFVATIENGAPGDTLETEAVNARLFAAAPELRKACEAVILHDKAVCAGWISCGVCGKPRGTHAPDCHIGMCQAALARTEP